MSESPSGHVFHPGHEALHGVTVVLEGRSGRLYIGRYHERVESGVLLHDAGVHDPASGVTRDEYLRKTIKFGVKAEHKALVVPNDEVGQIRKLGEETP